MYYGHNGTISMQLRERLRVTEFYIESLNVTCTECKWLSLFVCCHAAAGQVFPHGELFLLSFDLLDGDVQMLFVTILSSSGAGSSWNQEENNISSMVFFKAHSVKFKNVSTQVAQLGITFFL